MNDPYLSVAQVARLLGFHRNTIYDWINRGIDDGAGDVDVLYADVIVDRYSIPLSELIDFMETHYFPEDFEMQSFHDLYDRVREL